MRYTLLRTLDTEIRLDRFPVTYAHAVEILREFAYPQRPSVVRSISLWKEAQAMQPSGDWVDSDLELARWTIMVGPDQFRLISAEGNGIVKLEPCDTLDSAREFLTGIPTAQRGPVFLGYADETCNSVFKTSTIRGLEIWAPAIAMPSVTELASQLGYSPFR